MFERGLKSEPVGGEIYVVVFFFGGGVTNSKLITFISK